MVKFDRDHQKVEVLPNGVRLLTEKISHVRSISLGMWFLSGSRDENRKENGISHLIEHMLFKGTSHRSTEEIASSLESLGGHLDAFTTKEFTCYSARILDEHLPVAVDVLGDILQFSLLDPKELEKEKGVVFEEIKSFEDSPDEVSLELLTEAVFNGHPLSKSILGTRKSLSLLTRKKLIFRMHKNYIPSRTIIAAAGNVHHEKLSDLIQKTFPSRKKSKPYLPKSSYSLSPITPRFRFRKKEDISQAHVSLGTPTIPYGHPDRFPLILLNNIIGGSMSSRLFQKVREERGLVYSIQSFPILYSDIGFWGIYFASDPKKYREALLHIYSELERIQKEGLRTGELSRAKAQAKGYLTLSLESTSQRMYRLAQSEIYRGESPSTDKTLKEIDRVRTEEVMRLASTLLSPSRMSISIVGPLTKPKWSELH